MGKFTVVVLCVVMVFCAAVNGDTLVLRGSREGVDVNVKGVTDEYVSAIIFKKDLISLSLQFVDSKEYSDVIFLKGANFSVECKITQIAEDAVHIQIPVSKISSLQMSFRSQEEQVKSPRIDTGDRLRTTDVMPGKKESGQVETQKPEREMRKDSGQRGGVDGLRIDTGEKTTAAENQGKQYRLRTKKVKPEDLSEKEEKDDLPAKKALSRESVIGETVLKEERQEESEDELEQGRKLTEGLGYKGSEKVIGEDREEQKSAAQDVAQNATLGNVEGKILHSGKPLPGCSVKLQMLEKGGLLSRGYHPIEGAVELETVTDNNGIYHFANVSPGLYKLYWKPPSEAAWVRRFKMEPDVIVESGKLTRPRDVETLKRTLN